MSYEQRIYENFDDYLTLDAYLDDAGSELSMRFEDVIDETDLGFIHSTNQSLITNFVKVLAYPIYDEYYNDKIGYKDENVFYKRIVNTLLRKVNKWIINHKTQEELINLGVVTALDNFIQNGTTQSSTQENASAGSAVIQKSASTPTGITHSTSGESLDMELSHSGSTDTTSMEVDDNYDDKYTNFVGKTNGLHRNEVDRETDIGRTSSYKLAMEVIDLIPYSYINEVLTDVSQHFIQIY